ncbi:MAG: hypothetical protein MUF81_19655 [Verrucomicrobia bacterium]|nr:hypothetical protein [Verrucomicrobiota bacterium]
MRKHLILTLSLVCLGAWSAGAAAPKTNPFKELLITVPAAELPAKAAQLVVEARTREREARTISVVKAAVDINPAAAPAIVSAIARRVPDMAAVAAGTAAAEQPKQASIIAKAAAAAAPSKAGNIVEAVCRAVPNEYRTIAVAVSEAVPNAGKDILNAVASARPDLKPAVIRTLAGYQGVVPVASTISQIQPLPSAVQPVPTTSTPFVMGVRGPAVGPPYIPLSNTPTNINPGTSGDVPTGGRNYAAP